MTQSKQRPDQIELRESLALHALRPMRADGFSPASPLRSLLADARLRWENGFGSGSVIELCEHYAASLGRAGEENREAFASAGPRLVDQVEREHRARHGAAALAAELSDQRQRDAAVMGDSALVAYEAKWRLRLLRMRRAHPERWRVRGLSAEEVVDALTLRLLEIVRSEPEELPKHARAGREWGLQCLKHELWRLRLRFRLDVTPVDLDASPLFDSAQTLEQQWLDREADWARALARDRAERGLSQPQKKWLAALRSTADAGAFFRSSAQPNLSAASRALGKDRSSARRAYRELQGRFIKELKRLG